MVLVPDARRRVTLPSCFKPGQPVTIEPLEDGTFRLAPMVGIPENQLWAWHSKVQASVAKSLSEFRDGQSHSLESRKGKAFLKKLAGK
jgi:hypothetical protein